MSCYKVGPFNQTLFLGCSVRNFNMKLGWSSATSTCQVGLVNDPSNAINSINLNSFETHIDSINSKTKQIDKTSQAFNASDLDKTDPSKSLFRNIAKNLKDKHDDVVQEQGYSGKKALSATNGTDLDWYFPDPGFIADYDIDIIGCPVNFRFDNINFAGIVKNWSKNPQNLIDVEIDNFASLLKNTTMIIQGYLGSVSTLIPGTETFGFKYYFGKRLSYNVAVPSLEEGDYNGSINQGNSPNVINVFGYLDSKGISKWVSGRGIPANAIYDGLVYLLGGESRNQGRFSPYGGLVAKTPFDRKSGTLLTIGSSNNYKDTPAKITYDQVGVLSTVQAVDNLPRTIFRLNLTNIPRPPDGAYINDDTMDVLSFIDYCCDNAGVDYFIGCRPYSTGSNYTGEIQFTTVSRRKQNSLNAIKNFVKNIKATDKVVDYQYGEEFNESITKSILVGGPQKRLFQVSSVNYGVYRHRRIFEPSTATTRGALGTNFPVLGGGWFNMELNGANNRSFEPNILSTRPFDSSIGPPWRSVGNSVVAQSANNFYQMNPALDWTGSNGSYGTTIQGNYLKPSNPIPVFNLNDELIAPYFGIDANNNVRVTSYNSVTRQFSVDINANDIKGYFASANGTYSVTETELRYAQDSFESWWSYTKFRLLFGLSSPLGKLMYNDISSRYSPDIANQIFNGGFVLQQRLYTLFYEKFTSDYGGAPSDADAIDIGNFYFYNSDIEQRAQSLHNFLATLASVHYGKTFMFRIPMSYTVDGNNRIIWNQSITDGAWEEIGTSLDDLMIHGDSNSNKFLLNDGRIGPFVGFNTSNEKSRPPVLTPGIGENFGDYSPCNIQGSTVTVSYQGSRSLGPISWYPGSLNYAHGGAIQPFNCSKTYVSCTPEIINQVRDENQNVVMSNGIFRSVFRIPGATISSDNGNLPMISELLALGTNKGIYSSPFYDAIRFMVLGGLPFNLSCSDRAALPVFAAVPVAHNFSPYGPWASHPGMISNSIFDNYGPSNVNNLIGGTNVEIDTTMVPWEYGSMEKLDNAGMLRVGAKDKYEQVLEYGFITVADLLLSKSNLGDRLSNGPYITSINTNIADQGIRTTYNFRTYSRKIGFYNKEQVDNLKFLNQKRIEYNTKLRASQKGY